MAKFNGVIKVTRSQLNTLLGGGSVVVGGVTYTYDNNTLYVCDDADYVDLGETEEETGTLTQAEFDTLRDDLSAYILLNDEKFYFFNDKGTYTTYMTQDTPVNTQVTYKALYIQVDSSAVNYRHWSVEDVSVGGGVTIDVGSTGYSSHGTVFPQITKADAQIIYNAFSQGKSPVVQWTYGGATMTFNVLQSDLSNGDYWFDLQCYAQYIVTYSWSSATGTNADIDIQPLIQLETIYDSSSPDANINWGYTSGIGSGVNLTKTIFTKYKYFIATFQTGNNTFLGFGDMTMAMSVDDRITISGSHYSSATNKYEEELIVIDEYEYFSTAFSTNVKLYRLRGILK